MPTLRGRARSLRQMATGAGCIRSVCSAIRNDPYRYGDYVREQDR